MLIRCDRAVGCEHCGEHYNSEREKKSHHGW